MSWMSIGEMFRMGKHSHSQNIRFYGGGKASFLIFGMEIPEQNLWSLTAFMPSAMPQ